MAVTFHGKTKINDSQMQTAAWLKSSGLGGYSLWHS